MTMASKVTFRRITVGVLLLCFMLNIIIGSIPIYYWTKSMLVFNKTIRNETLYTGSTLFSKYSDHRLYKSQRLENMRRKRYVNITNYTAMPKIFSGTHEYNYVIFSSLVPSPKRYIVYNNTKWNWPSLGNKVKAVLFTNSTHLADEFVGAGWDVLPLLNVSVSGTPVLKYMFMNVAQRYSAAFIGYSNSDILFTDKLTETLNEIRTNPWVSNSNTMLTGRRINMLNVTVGEAATLSSLSRASRKRGILFRADAEDYFFTNRFYPWNTIPEVVIGRVAYDNFLLLHARLSNFTTVDLSQTVVAIHQNVDRGHLEDKWKTKEKELHYNNYIIQKTFKSVNYNAGHTICLQFETQNKSSEIIMFRRRIFAKYCAFKTSKKVR